MPEFTHLLLGVLPLLSYGAGLTQGSPLIKGEEVLLDFQPEEYKTYNLNILNNSITTIIVTACSAPIEWNVFQSTADSFNATSILLHSSVTNEREMYKLPLKNNQSGYTIKLKMNRFGYGSIIATDIEENRHKHNGKLLMKWKSQRELILRWSKHKTTFLEPNYCVVLTNSRPQTNLCNSLTEDEYKHLSNTTRKHLVASFIENFISSKDQIVYCTNTNLLKLNLDPLLQSSVNNSSGFNKIYASLFVFDEDTRLARHIASNETVSIKPTVDLKENKMTYIKLNNNPVTLSLKIMQKSLTNRMLDLYVVPCDVRLHLEVDVSLNSNQLVSRTDIVGFGKLSVPNVHLKKPYLITVTPGTSNVTTGLLTLPTLKSVQVFATTSAEFNPYPEIPRRPAVKEYKTLRTCRSVTVGWIPPKGLRSANYCMVVKQGKVNHGDFVGNQCNLNAQLRPRKVAANDVAKMCKQMKHTARISVLTQKIDKLKPGRFYNVQIMVRKPRGRMLSYEVLQVRTKSKC